MQISDNVIIVLSNICLLIRPLNSFNHLMLKGFQESEATHWNTLSLRWASRIRDLGHSFMDASHIKRCTYVCIIWMCYIYSKYRAKSVFPFQPIALPSCYAPPPFLSLKRQRSPTYSPPASCLRAMKGVFAAVLYLFLPYTKPFIFCWENNIGVGVEVVVGGGGGRRVMKKVGYKEEEVKMCFGAKYVWFINPPDSWQLL